MKYQANNGINLALFSATTSVTSEQTAVCGHVQEPFPTVTVHIPALSLTEWQKREPDRFVGYHEQSEASFLRERGDNAHFAFARADSSPSVNWFRPSAREAAWFFTHGYAQTLGVLGVDVLIETSSSVLMMSHFYIREDRVLLKVTEGKLEFVFVPAGETLPENACSVWRRRLPET